jgi:mRNA interferase YafQ
MTYKIEYAGKIKKDIKLAQKRKLDMSLFKSVVEILEEKGKLPAAYKPHPLKGNYNNYWECHPSADGQPDCPSVDGLIWKQDDDDKIIYLSRTGTHSDLF